MSKVPPPRIFISGNSEEFSHFRQVATEAVLMKGWIPVAQDHFATQHGSLPDLLKKLVVSCDAVICMVGKRFGNAPRQANGSGGSRSYTQMEYDFAREARKPVYLFFGKDLPEGDAQSDEHVALQNAFVEEIRATNDIRDFFRNEDELRLRILAIEAPQTKKRPSLLWPVLGLVAALMLLFAVISSSGESKTTDAENPTHAAAEKSEDISATALPVEGDEPGAVPVEAAASKAITTSLGMQFLPLGVSAAGDQIYLSRWETRVADWQAFADETAIPFEAPSGATKLHPVSKVALSKMVAFCDWMTAKESATGTIPAGAKFRLPTLNEWRMAAGISPDQVGVVYPWGAADPSSERPTANFCGRESALGNSRLPDDGFTKTSPSGSFPAFSSGGFQDLAGNVGEVCTIKDARPVICGGDWQDMDFERMNLTSYLPYDPVDDVSERVGFRCVLEMPAASAR